MAIVSVNKIWSGESSDWSKLEGGQTAEHQLTEIYDVVVDNTPTQDTTLTVKADPSVPQRGDAHTDNFYLRVDNVRCDRISPILFKLTVHYNAVGANSPDDNPINEPARIKYVTIKSEGEIDEDINGSPLVTVNGEPIKGVRRKFSDLGLNIKKNFATFNPVLFYVYIDSISNDAFHGFPAGVCYLDELTAEPVVENGFAFVKVEAMVIFRRPIRTTNDRAWWSRVRHEGFIEKKIGTFSDELVHATDDKGEYMTRPVMLKPDGTRETDASIGHWLEFEILDNTSFNSMGFGV